MENIRKIMRKGVLLMLALLLIGGESMTASAAGTPALNKKTATLTVGKTLQLKMKNTSKKVSWSSNKKSVATVTSTGKVKAVKAGKAKITAKVSGKKYYCTVTVKNANSKATNVKFKNAAGGDFIKGVSKATASFKLKYASTGVQVKVQTLGGKTVYTKTFSKCKANTAYSFTWNGKNSKGSYVSGGTYRLCIIAGSTKTYSKELKFITTKDFTAGDGSKSNPYQVKNLTQLKKVGKYNGRYFVQIANINGGNANFTPLFTTDNPFTGVYNGKNYTISNLYFRKIGDTGLFSAIGEKGTVQNVRVTNFHFVYSDTGWQNYSHGTIAGVNKGKIRNCRATNCNLQGVSYIHRGGICGYNRGLVEKCIVQDMTIVNETLGGNAGGIVAFNETGQIVDCTAKNLTISGYFVGGIVGECNDGTVSGCSTSEGCALKCHQYCGAIAGRAANSTFTDCYTDTDYNLVGSGYNYIIQ